MIKKLEPRMHVYIPDAVCGLNLGRHGIKVACHTIYNAIIQLSCVYPFITPLIIEWIMKFVENFHEKWFAQNIFFYAITSKEKKYRQRYLKVVLGPARYEDELAIYRQCLS